MKLHIQLNTFLKQNTGQSNPKDTKNFVFVREGESFPISNYEWMIAVNHYKITLRNRVNDILTWYVFAPHVSILDDEGNPVVLFNRPADTGPVVNRKELPTVEAKPSRGASIQVGNTRYALSDSIIPGGNFTWEEAITYDIRRIPNRQQADTIIALAKRLQPYRNRVGIPFEVTSWFRPEPFNRQAGGATRSQHLGGGAVDIKIKVNNRYVSGVNMYRQYFRDWQGGIGVYPNIPNIIHLDIGPRRIWGI